MKKQPDVSAKEMRKRDFEGARREVEARVDAAISLIDAHSPQAAVDHADTLIGEGGKRVEELTVEWMYADLQGAIADVSSSANQVTELATLKAGAQAELSTLPASGGVQMTVAVFYIVGALVAFFTELKLTDALVDLLGYRRDDPTGRAIGAAFASAMLVFDLIFTRLALVSDPWSLFRAAESNPDQAGAPKRGRRAWWLRASGAAALVFTFLAIAWLQILTVVKMAPTRSIDASYQRDHRALTAREDQIVEDSILFFSVCVLVSGGFMAAAGTKELSLWLRRKALERTIRQVETTRWHAIFALDKTEMPNLAGELENAGVPCMWLSTEPLGELVVRLKEAFGARSQLPPGIRAAAAEARMFEATKRIDLRQARTKPAAPPQLKSWRETVDEALGDAVLVLSSGFRLGGPVPRPKKSWVNRIRK
jgi:hypothetical protein